MKVSTWINLFNCYSVTSILFILSALKETSTSAFQCLYVQKINVVASHNRSSSSKSKCNLVSRQKCNILQTISGAFDKPVQSTRTNAHTQNYEEYDDDNNDDEEEGDDDDEDEYFATDEEALLACRAYLQRKNRLGWTQAKRRKALAQNSLALAPLSPTTVEDTTQASRNLNAGYFWEDPSELIYLKKSRPRRLVQKNKMLGNETEPVFDDGDEEFLLEFSDDDDEEDDVADDDDDEDNEEESGGIQMLRADANEEEGGIFTSFPAFAPTSHIIQSQSKKEQFQDPEWKAKWYSKRWGDKKGSKKRERQKRQKKIKKLIQNIPSEILRSSELAALTDEEIEDAIHTYILANRKRQKSHLKRTEEREQILRDNSLSTRRKSRIVSEQSGNKPIETQSFLSFMPSEDDLKEIQKARSKRAAKAYETRLQNKKSKETENHTELGNRKCSRVIDLREIIVAGELSPRQAMERIEEMKKENKCPLVQDIDRILEPKRLAGRKELLRLILSDSFDLKGKCIPDLSMIKENEDEFYSNTTAADVEKMSKKFVTQSTVNQLGSFVKYMLSENATRTK